MIFIHLFPTWKIVCACNIIHDIEPASFGNSFDTCSLVIDDAYFVYYVILQNIPPTMVEKVGGKVFTFGSYRLGVHTKGLMNISPQSLIYIFYSEWSDSSKIWKWWSFTLLICGVRFEQYIAVCMLLDRWARRKAGYFRRICEKIGTFTWYCVGWQPLTVVYCKFTLWPVL